MEILIDAGADIKVKDTQNGNTILHYLIRNHDDFHAFTISKLIILYDDFYEDMRKENVIGNDPIQILLDDLDVQQDNYLTFKRLINIEVIKDEDIDLFKNLIGEYLEDGFNRSDKIYVVSYGEKRKDLRLIETEGNIYKRVYLFLLFVEKYGCDYDKNLTNNIPKE